MTCPSGEEMLEGLDVTPEERFEFLRAVAETDAEEAGVPYGDEDDGPWHDGSEMDQLEAIGGQLDARRDLNGTRVGEDIVAQLDRRPTDEARLARALPRIEAGTYTEDPYFRGDPAAAAAARDPLGRWQAACGPLDDFGRCAARYHDPDCHTTVESAAARGSYAEVEAWNATLAGRTPEGGVDAEALGLANEPRPGDGGDLWADLLEAPGGPGSAGPGLHSRVLAYMGEIDAEPEPRGPGPDTTAIRAALGL